MKLLVLGGGPGGYVAAIKAAQLGAEVTIVEKQYFGGTCLNVGCIPTKVLLHTADLYHMMNDASYLGIKADKIEVDWDRLLARKREVIQKLVGGVESLLANNQVTMIRGQGSFVTKNQLEVVVEGGHKEMVTFDRAIIATGSEPTIFPIPGIEGENILTSNEVLSFETLPESMCIVGGGVIGSEFASVFSRLGVKVTIVEMLPRIVRAMDDDVVQFLDYELKSQGVEILTGSKVEKFESCDAQVKVEVSTPEGKRSIMAEKVLLSIGRRPMITNMGLERIGIRVDRGIVVNDRMQTNVKNIYAIGDCTGGVMLAHVASAQGIVAAEDSMNSRIDVEFKSIPYCVYTKPEIAGVGMTEEQVQEAGMDYSVGRFPLMANGKSLILGETDGLVKFIVDNATNEILGMHMAGPKATELIVEGALAIRLEATIDEIITTIHAHPTVGESLHEAAHAVYGHAIHLPH